LTHGFRVEAKRADANAPLAIPHRYSISKLRAAASGQRPTPNC
jgi:hypothetical protein